MSIAEKAGALLEAIANRDLEAMRPAARRRLADRCRRLAELADAVDRPAAPKEGVLARLAGGHRAE